MSFKIITEDLSKEFANQSLFSGLNLTFQSPDSYVLMGPNGSGKSSLLQILLGYSMPSKGKIIVEVNGKQVEEEDVYLQHAFAAPYIDLPEDLSTEEIINLHFSLRAKINDTSTEEIIAKVGLSSSKKKYIKYFSSGMKQRLKLALAFYTKSHSLLLDEPCTNLDQEGIDIYHHLIETMTLNRLVIIASNQLEEYKFCKQKLVIGN